MALFGGGVERSGSVNVSTDDFPSLGGEMGRIFLAALTGGSGEDLFCNPNGAIPERFISNPWKPKDLRFSSIFLYFISENLFNS